MIKFCAVIIALCCIAGYGGCRPKTPKASAPVFVAPSTPSFSLPMPSAPRLDPLPPEAMDPSSVPVAPDLTKPTSSPNSLAPDAPPTSFPQ